MRAGAKRGVAEAVDGAAAGLGVSGVEAPLSTAAKVAGEAAAAEGDA